MPRSGRRTLVQDFRGAAGTSSPSVGNDDDDFYSGYATAQAPATALSLYAVPFDDSSA